MKWDKEMRKTITKNQSLSNWVVQESEKPINKEDQDETLGN